MQEPPTVAVQQPPEHEVASQMHRPVVMSQRWPMPQAPQLAPLAPHMLSISEASASQVVPLQQPAHPVPPPQLHAPPEHD